MALKVFVADDSVTTQKVVGLAFSGEDVNIEAVSHGDAALDAIRKFRPDIVLADVLMPGCNGYEVCARIKESPELSGVPVILVVGTFEPFDQLEAERVKADGCLTKPFDTSELTQMIRSLTAARQEVSQESGPARVSASVMESYLGSNRVLDLLVPEAVQKYAQSPAPTTGPAGKEFFAEGNIPEEFIDAIVDKVVRRMSAEVVREIAWEVVPELSEQIIRRSLDEQTKS